MGRIKKTDRSQNKDILSVGPITSRETIGPEPCNKTLLRALFKRQRGLWIKYLRTSAEIKQLNAALQAMGWRPDETLEAFKRRIK